MELMVKVLEHDIHFTLRYEEYLVHHFSWPHEEGPLGVHLLPELVHQLLQHEHGQSLKVVNLHQQPF